MLFTGREVRVGKICARGLVRRPRVVLKTKGTGFSHTDRPSPENNFLFVCFGCLLFKVGKEIGIKDIT